MLSRISNLGGGDSIWGGKCSLESPIFGVRDSIWGGKFLSPNLRDLGGGKFGAENAISNLPPNLGGGDSIWGGKCYLPNLEIWGVENLGWKVLSRISNLGGGEAFGAENAPSPQISRFEIAFSTPNLGRKILESPIFGVREIWGPKVLSPKSRDLGGGWKIWGGKCSISQISRFGRVENLGWKMLSPQISSFEIAWTPNFPPPQMLSRDHFPNFPPPQIWIRKACSISNLVHLEGGRIFRPKFSTHPNLGIRDSIFRPKFSTPQISNSR